MKCADAPLLVRLKPYNGCFHLMTDDVLLEVESQRFCPAEHTPPSTINFIQTELPP